MGLRHLPMVVARHRRHFPENLIGRLGGRLLTRYYRTFLDTPYASAEVIHRDGEVAGFLVGVLNTRLHRLHRRRAHRVGLLCAGLGAAIKHPVLSSSIARRRLMVARPAATTAATSLVTVAVLSHVAIDHSFQGQGLGGLLVDRFIRRARQAGADRICVATAEGATTAQQFYLGRGWQLTSYDQTVDGRTIALFDLPLGGPR